MNQPAPHSPKSRLSASKIACLFRCPREYAFRYILEVKESRNKALELGTQFHALLEGKNATVDVLRSFDAEYPWGHALRVMKAGYDVAMNLPEKSVAHEVKFENDEISVRIDEIRAGESGCWWMVEHKTASLLSATKKRTIPREIQACCYVAHVAEIAEVAWVAPEKFRGLVYTTTLKPLERRKKDETADKFGERMTSSTVLWQYHEYQLKHATMQWESMLTWFRTRIEEIHTLYDATKSVESLPGNTAQCERYGNPCPYMDFCHGCEETIAEKTK
jgi:hypothetical protein